MATRNDITGDALVTKTNNDKYRDGWDRIFGNKKTATVSEPVKGQVEPATTPDTVVGSQEPDHSNSRKK